MTQPPEQAPAAEDEAPPRFSGKILVEGPLDPARGVEAFLRALERGDPWYGALLDVIARWTAPSERLGGHDYEYLLSGEAFDWLRLAQRLIEVADRTLPDAIPADESEALLFAGLAPDGGDEGEFARAIGAQKHRAHLNFQYGVIVEDALLLAAEQEMQKAGALTGTRRSAEVEAFERVYGKPLSELRELYGEETGTDIGGSVGVAEWQAFIYWCSKYRFRTAEPARVASDTRKALALLSQMDRHRRRITRERARAAQQLDAIDVGGRASVPRAAETSMWTRARRVREREAATSEDE